MHYRVHYSLDFDPKIRSGQVCLTNILTNFMTNFLMSFFWWIILANFYNELFWRFFWQFFYLLTIVSFRIRVPLILFFIKLKLCCENYSREESLGRNYSRAETCLGYMVSLSPCTKVMLALLSKCCIFFCSSTIFV